LLGSSPQAPSHHQTFDAAPHYSPILPQNHFKGDLHEINFDQNEHYFLVFQPFPSLRKSIKNLFHVPLLACEGVPPPLSSLIALILV
jgi:hypothetical protein